MRVTSCPDCGEVVEIPPPSDEDDEMEIICQMCGLSGPASDWQAYAPEDDESLLGRPLAAATIPASVPKSWALRVEQLEEIREVVGELTFQVRLLRQVLDELNQDLPEIVKRQVATLCPEGTPPPQSVTIAAGNQPVSAEIPTPKSVRQPAAPTQPAGNAKTRRSPSKRKEAASSANQSGLW